jgi:hypothetical protein
MTPSIASSVDSKARDTEVLTSCDPWPPPAEPVTWNWSSRMVLAGAGSPRLEAVAMVPRGAGLDAAQPSSTNLNIDISDLHQDGWFASCD